MGRGRDLTREVAVEVVPVAGSPQQPRPGSGRTRQAERLDDVDPSPAADPFGEPEQGIGSASAALQRVGGERAEPIGEQADAADQFDVLLRPVSGQERQSDRGRAPVGAVPDQPPRGAPNRFPVRPESGRGDVVIVVDRDGDVVEGPGSRGCAPGRAKCASRITAARMPARRPSSGGFGRPWPR